MPTPPLLLIDHLQHRDALNRGAICAPLRRIKMARKFEDVFPAKLKELFDLGWFLAGSAALYLALPESAIQHWKPRDLDFYTKAGFGTNSMRKTLEFIRLNFRDTVWQVANGIVQVVLREENLDLQFILAPVPQPFFPYLLYNFDISVCGVALETPGFDEVIMTPLAANNIERGVIDVCPQMIGDFACARLRKYFHRGFALRLVHTNIIARVGLNFLLTHSIGQVTDNTFVCDPSMRRYYGSELPMRAATWILAIMGRTTNSSEANEFLKTADASWRDFIFGDYWRRRDRVYSEASGAPSVDENNAYDGFLS